MGEGLVWKKTLTLVRTRWRRKSARVWFGKNTDLGEDKMVERQLLGLVW